MSKERLLPIRHDEKTSSNDHESMHERVTRLWNDCCDFYKKALEIGRDDPRKVIYSIKMGSTLALVSLTLFWKGPFRDISQFSIWAILTVVVMFEFSIGATFIKGFNRAFGTFCAGMLAFLFAGLTVLAGDWEKVIIVISFFATGAFASYLRFYPKMVPYEYGFRVFVLTYCVLMVAGNRSRDYTEAIISRLVLIGLAACACFIVNICIYPIWSGDDLHTLVVNNFKDLATSLEGCVNGYLKYGDFARSSFRFSTEPIDNDQLYTGYKSVIESETRERTLLGFAIWEPPHGRYRKLHHPWSTYVKASSAVRHCAYSVMALHGCILSEIQAPPEKRQVFRSQLQRVSAEGARILRLLGDKIEKMEQLGTPENILKQVHEAGEQLQKKIDQRSFLLVNSENWEIGSQSKELEGLDLEHNRPPRQKDFESMQMGFRSQSATAVFMHSSYLRSTSIPKKDWSKQELRKHAPWPSLISFEGEGLIKEDEIKTYHSASALSLATFSSLLIEFVARLQNVVDCFEELSKEAGFKDPNMVVLAERGGVWTRFLRFLRLKS